jgi:hypothetical protein
MLIIPLIISTLFNTSIPSMGTRNPADIPVPKKNFDVTIVDTDNLKLELTSFSCDGEVYIKGTIGKAQGIVSFEKINSIVFTMEDSNLTGKLTLKNGDVITMKIKRTLPFYGKTSFGNFIIRAEDIKSITFK